MSQRSWKSATICRHAVAFPCTAPLAQPTSPLATASYELHVQLLQEFEEQRLYGRTVGLNNYLVPVDAPACHLGDATQRVFRRGAHVTLGYLALPIEPRNRNHSFTFLLAVCLRGRRCE